MLTIETQRLQLRQWNIASDLEAFSRINQDPKVMEFFPSTLTKEQTLSLLENIQTHFNTHGFGIFACTLSSSRELLGFVGLNTPTFAAHFTPCIEIGWRLGSQFWGKGYATEAAIAVLDYALNQLNIPSEKIVSFTTRHNIRSRHVMEKIGLTYDPRDDFAHPALTSTHPLSAHVLYRLQKSAFNNPS